MCITIEELIYQYDSNFKLDVNNILFTANSISVVIGPNGSGKSTLLKVLSGIFKDYSGSIKCFEKDFKKLSAKEISQTISFVNAGLSALPLLKVYDAVSTGRFPYTRTFGFLRDEDKEKIDEAITITELKSKVDFYLNQLSTGELQRVSIARAIAQDTKMIVMDEPLSNLDPKYTLKIINIIKKIKGSKIIIIAMHDINLALNISDKLLGLKDGKLYFQFDKSENFDLKEIDTLFNVNFKKFEKNIFLDLRHTL